MSGNPSISEAADRARSLPNERGRALFAGGIVCIRRERTRNVGRNRKRPARWEVEGMRRFCRALIVLCFMIFPAARVMAQDPLPLQVVEQPLLLVGKTAASGVLQVVSFLNLTIGVPVACIGQAIADKSASGCSVGAGKAWDGSNFALCESGSLAVEAWTFGRVTWPPCRRSS